MRALPLTNRILWIIRTISDRIKGGRFPEISKDLALKENIFKAPPFTTEIVKVIRLLAPHLRIKPDEESRRYWEKEQNATCWGEYIALHEYLLKIPNPKKVLEIGPGMGRSVIFFKKQLEWGKTEYHLYEGEGNKTKYTTLGPRCNDSFCGSISALKQILEYNNINNYKILEPEKFDFKLSALPGPYDIIYSFYAIGFHWSLEHYIDDILKNMHEETLAFFTVHNDFIEFEKLRKVNFKVIDYRVAYPANKIFKILVMAMSKI